MASPIARNRPYLWSLLVLGGLMILPPGVAEASFHCWDITEVYSNQDGTIQFIELTTTFTGQTVMANKVLRATWDDGSATFIFPAALSSYTGTRRLLIATPAFGVASGVSSDTTAVLPCGFFPVDETAISLCFGTSAACSTDVVTFNMATLLANPDQSLNRSGSTGCLEASVALAVGNLAGPTPTNFDTTADPPWTPSACEQDGSCEPCNDADFCDGAESCSGTACTGGTAPCPLDTPICLEADDDCVECTLPGHCNDSIQCTTDTCDDGACVNAPIVGSCNDGLFCTAGDTCNDDLECEGTGSPCGDDESCTEELHCFECDSAGDCADGVFCNGAELCVDNACEDATLDPCGVGEVCDEVAVDHCAQCFVAGHCVADSNLCTDTICDQDNTCQHVPNTDDCDDSLFCNGDNDTCSGGACSGSEDPCDPDPCLEGIDDCGTCLNAGQCTDPNSCTVETCDEGLCVSTDVGNDTDCADDVLFCNGDETCQDGVCTSSGTACSGNTDCDEAGDECVVQCGNGRIDEGEDCDDENTDDDDGCGADCSQEDGWDCAEDPGPNSVCIPICGDGVRLGDEACDDGNDRADDGCDPDCLPDDGFDCTGGDAETADTCNGTLNDGLVRGTEECDDDNEVDDDGCTDGTVDDGFVCDDSEPSNCEADVADPDPDPGPDPEPEQEEDAGGDEGGEDGGVDTEPDAPVGADTEGDASVDDGPDAATDATVEDEGCACSSSRVGAADLAVMAWGLMAMFVLHRRRR